jgi:hypothetical protein
MKALVILAPYPPSSQMWKKIGIFPKVFFVQVHLISKFLISGNSQRCSGPGKGRSPYCKQRHYIEQSSSKWTRQGWCLYRCTSNNDIQTCQKRKRDSYYQFRYILKVDWLNCQYIPPIPNFWVPWEVPKNLIWKILIMLVPNLAKFSKNV